jgi:transcriptional regulator with XRE-family HTH domain
MIDLQKQRASRTMSAIDDTIAARIRYRRKLLKISCSDLAHQIGVSCQQFQKYESAQNRVSAGRLKEISTALLVPIDYFYSGQPDTDGFVDYPSSPCYSQSAHKMLFNDTTDNSNSAEMAFAAEYAEAVSLYLALSHNHQRLLLELLRSMRSEPSRRSDSHLEIKSRS